MGEVVRRRFFAPAGRLRRDEHEAARDALAAVREGLRPEAWPSIDRALAVLRSEAASSRRWEFAMISMQHCDLVTDYLAEHSVRPLMAVRLWLRCLGRLDPHTNDITATRQQLADSLGIPARDVSRIMGELEALGAVSRRVERAGKARGAGTVVYSVNPVIGTRMRGEVRAEAQRAGAALFVFPGPSSPERRSRSRRPVPPVL